MNTRLSACVFFLKAHTDSAFWENVITTGEYTLDIITTLSGVGNLAKFRHLARLVRIAKAGKKSKELIWSYKAVKTIKGTSAYVEISSGTINALLKLTGVNDTAFGEVLSKYLFYLELFTLTGELAVGIKGYLRNSAEELLEHNDFEKHLDDLVEKGELDEVGKGKLLDELYEISDVRKIVDTGLRGVKPLTKFEKKEILDYVKKHYGEQAEELVQFADYQSTNDTGYMALFDVLYINTDIMPGTLKTANSRLSWRAALAHEHEGHRAAALTDKTFFNPNLSSEANNLLEEIQASLRASINGKGLSETERLDLLDDALERFENHNAILKGSIYENQTFNEIKNILWLD